MKSSVAERGGFEPPIQSPVCRISSAVQSTTLPPFQYVSGWRWIRTTEAVKQQIYSLPHLATLVSTRAAVDFSIAGAKFVIYFLNSKINLSFLLQ